jgi:hypothetical protein
MLRTNPLNIGHDSLPLKIEKVRSVARQLRAIHFLVVRQTVGKWIQGPAGQAFDGMAVGTRSEREAHG